MPVSDPGLDRPRPDPWDEAARLLALCNACNYCNGYCETFRAAERLSSFSRGDVASLANLCHQCRNCWYACQYAPPHPFAVNLPRTLAEVRAASWRRYAWPWAFDHLGWISLGLTLLPVLLCLILVPADRLFAPHIGPGAFYAVIPWGVLSLAAALPLAVSGLGMAVGLRRFWRESGGRAVSRRAVGLALADLVALRNLDGGGVGCTERGPAFSRRRKLFHHLLMLGLVSCLLSTLVATLYHHALGRIAPYPVLSLPVSLGTLGGGLMIAGLLGLAWGRLGADPAPTAAALAGGERLFLAQLLAVAGSGLALLALRDGALMGILLALHLGTVVAFFATLPFGKFAHAPYRAAALLRAAQDRPS